MKGLNRRIIALLFFLLYGFGFSSAKLVFAADEPIYTTHEQVPGQGVTSSFVDFLGDLYAFGIGSVAILAMVMIGIGAFVYIVTSAGNASKMADGKDMIFNAIWGLIIALVAFLLLYMINPDLVKGDIVNIDNVQDLKKQKDNIQDLKKQNNDGGLPKNKIIAGPTTGGDVVFYCDPLGSHEVRTEVPLTVKYWDDEGNSTDVTNQSYLRTSNGGVVTIASGLARCPCDENVSENRATIIVDYTDLETGEFYSTEIKVTRFN